MAEYGERRDDRRGERRNDRSDNTHKLAAPQQTQCRFCRRGEEYVDYKDIETLQKLLTHRGKIYSRKRSGNCAGCQARSNAQSNAKIYGASAVLRITRNSCPVARAPWFERRETKIFYAEIYK